MKNFLIAVSLILSFTGCVQFTNNEKSVDLGAVGCEADGLDVRVSRVIDGDTIEFVCDSAKYKVRIIGIDSPETKDPRKPKQCFGEEATERMKDLVGGNVVRLFVGLENKDKYGRLLRYVYRGDEDIGKMMIEGGFAFAYRPFGHEKLGEYVGVEGVAKGKGKGLGLWNKENCNY